MSARPNACDATERARDCAQLCQSWTREPAPYSAIETHNAKHRSPHDTYHCFKLKMKRIDAPKSCEGCTKTKSDFLTKRGFFGCSSVVYATYGVYAFLSHSRSSFRKPQGELLAMGAILRSPRGA
jgi:hypothetical protein